MQCECLIQHQVSLPFHSHNFQIQHQTLDPTSSHFQNIFTTNWMKKDGVYILEHAIYQVLWLSVVLSLLPNTCLPFKTLKNKQV